MLQTHSSASALDFLMPEAKPSPSRQQGDPSGFSKEFDRQLQCREAGCTGPRAGDPADTSASASGEAPPSEVALGDAEEDLLTAEGQEDGKILPLDLPFAPWFGEYPSAELSPEEEDPALNTALSWQWSGTGTQQQALGEGEGGMDDEVDGLMWRDGVRQGQVVNPLERAAESGASRAGKSTLAELINQGMAQRSSTSADPLTGTTAMPVSSATTNPLGGTTLMSQGVPTQMALGHPVQQKGWDQAMSQRVIWMVRHNMQEAQIQLNPRELGPINVRVSVFNDQAHVQFIAQHATTREALEAAMPRLREMLSESGLNLAQSDVSQHQAGQQEDGKGQPTKDLGSMEVADNGDGQDALTDIHVGHLGPPGVDYFV